MVTVWQASLLLGLSVLGLTTAAEEPVPNDVRYTLEEFYGKDRAQWPNPIYRRDLNHDGLPDWVAQQSGCRDQDQCQVDVFICTRGKAPDCDEYCYSGNGRASDMLKDPVKLKCQSTC